jgi:hypothetical protein
LVGSVIGCSGGDRSGGINSFADPSRSLRAHVLRGDADLLLGAEGDLASQASGRRH